MKDEPRSVLVVAPRPPLDPTNGVDLIALNVFPRLSRAWKVTLVAYEGDGDSDDARARLAAMFHEVHLVPNSGRVPELLGWLAGDLARMPIKRLGGLDLTAARGFKQTLASALAGQRHDIIHVRNLVMAPFVRQYRHPKLIEVVDSPVLAAQRSSSAGARARLRRFVAGQMEREAAHRFDAVTTVSPGDAAALQLHSGKARVEVVPNGVDTQFYRPTASLTDGDDVIVFLGAMEYGPNIDAVEWLALSVLPRLSAPRAPLTVRLIGRDPSAEMRSFAAIHGLELTGTVPDVRPYLAEAMVFVAPMVSGSGIKNKVLEAMAMALPIVATTLAVEALEIQDGVHCLVADDATDFAAAIGRLLGDPELRLRIGQNARRLVETQYSWDATARRYEEIYDSLLRARSSGRQ